MKIKVLNLIMLTIVVGLIITVAQKAYATFPPPCEHKNCSTIKEEPAGDSKTVRGPNGAAVSASFSADSSANVDCDNCAGGHSASQGASRTLSAFIVSTASETVTGLKSKATFAGVSCETGDSATFSLSAAQQ